MFFLCPGAIITFSSLILFGISEARVVQGIFNWSKLCFTYLIYMFSHFFSNRNIFSVTHSDRSWISRGGGYGVFWISRFSLTSTFCGILHFVIWLKSYNWRYFSFMVVFKIEFFICATFLHSLNFKKKHVT